jgi:hypothetical protein
MSTSAKTPWLSKPQGDEKISEGTLGYITARIRQRAYDLVVREFKKSGITQATLARRWGKAPEVVSRFLARPGNWELDTFTEALFVINGAIPSFSTTHAAEQIISASRPMPPRAQASTADTFKVGSPSPIAAAA